MMENSFIIENLLQHNVGPRLEWKALPDLDEIAKTITAFINTQGGDLIIGMDETGKISEVENVLQQVDAIRMVLVQNIKPTAPISVQPVNYKKKNIILISVWEGAKKPYLYKGLIYGRSGMETHAITPDGLSKLISQRKQADFHWERMPVLGAELKDLDSEEIKQTLKLYKEYKKDNKIENYEDFLIQTGLIQNGNITNACMVLYGKNPIRFIPQCRIRLTLYPYITSGNQFIDDIIFDGNIFKNIESIFKYLDIIYGKSLTVSGLIRTDKSNYPALALREGILNAIVHRDYNSVKGFMQISIFSDRTEISNYGGLPEGITIADLKTEHHSILRNPDIAQICFLRKYIEMLGSGTLRMINDCRVNRFSIPHWKEKDNITTVVFPSVTHNKSINGVNEGVNDGVNDGVNILINEGVNDGVIDGVNDGVKIEIIRAVNLILEREGANATDIAVNRRKSKPTIERYLRIAKQAGIIEFKGAPKTGGYYLTEKAKKLIKK